LAAAFFRGADVRSLLDAQADVEMLCLRLDLYISKVATAKAAHGAASVVRSPTLRASRLTANPLRQAMASSWVKA
jgi:hypothetical protein